jgi:hypothetical protein
MEEDWVGLLVLDLVVDLVVEEAPSLLLAVPVIDDAVFFIFFFCSPLHNTSHHQSLTRENTGRIFRPRTQNLYWYCVAAASLFSKPKQRLGHIIIV